MKFDLHIHSKYSYDSFLSPEMIIKVAKKKGLNGIAVTDHNTIRGGFETLKANKDEFLRIIVGAEIRTEYGDVIGLFLNSEIKERKFNNVIDEIRSQGGISILAHPYRKYQFPERLLKGIDLIECFNSRSKRILNEKSYLLARSYKKSMTGGSDAHLALDIGKGLTITDCEIERALRKGKTQIVGRESNYYIGHGFSLLSENVKKLSFLIS